MNPLIFNLGPTELIIILVIVLLLFGGSRLAGLGKSTGRALKEFKEETKDLTKKEDETPAAPLPPQVTDRPTDAAGTPWPQQGQNSQPQNHQAQSYQPQGSQPQNHQAQSYQPQGYQQSAGSPVPESSRDDVRRDA